MRILLPLLLALLPTLAFADSYHFATCNFVKHLSGWTLGFSMGGTKEATRTDIVEASFGAPDAAFCNLLHGNGDLTQADLDLYAAVGAELHSDAKCAFSGRVIAAGNVHKVIREGEFALIEQPRPASVSMRDAVYLASPAEAAHTGWDHNACQRILQSFHTPEEGTGQEQETGQLSPQTKCSLPADQGPGSLHGAWARLPVALVFDREFYTENGGRDVAAMKRAVETWNRWARQKGKIAFVIAHDGLGLEIPALSDCSQPSYTNAMPQGGVVGIWKIGKTGPHANQRPSCGTQANGSPGLLLPSGVPGQTDWNLEQGKITAASVLLNFDQYNGPGLATFDLESETLHQLGHVLGLLHSCNGSSGGSADATTAPACLQGGVLAVPKAYADAVMFPFLLDGQVKHTLGQNDTGRVSCLY